VLAVVCLCQNVCQTRVAELPCKITLPKNLAFSRVFGTNRYWRGECSNRENSTTECERLRFFKNIGKRTNGRTTRVSCNNTGTTTNYIKTRLNDINQHYEWANGE